MKETNKKSDANSLYDLVMEYKNKNSISDIEMIDILVEIVADLKFIDTYLGYLANNQDRLQEQIEYLAEYIEIHTRQ